MQWSFVFHTIRLLLRRLINMEGWLVLQLHLSLARVHISHHINLRSCHRPIIIPIVHEVTTIFKVSEDRYHVINRRGGFPTVEEDINLKCT